MRERHGIAEIYDPTRGTVTTAATPLRQPWSTAVQLPDGRVLVDDRGTGELYDPQTDAWTDAGLPSYASDPSLGFRLTGVDNDLDYEFDTATVLPDGRVLLTIASDAILYDPGGSP